MEYRDLNFTEEELYKLNIHELRDLAREIGVSSPTTKQKGDLISATLAIVYGEAPKRDTRASAGRPARRRVKPSKLLFQIDEYNYVMDDKSNPFVEKYENDPAALYGGEDDSDEYLSDLYNPYSKIHVASSKVEYKNSKSGKEQKKHSLEIKTSKNILDAAKRMRELLGRETNENMEVDEDASLGDLEYVSGYVFLGAEQKLYIAYPEDDRSQQTIYLLPKKLVELFAIRAGDFIDCWVDENSALVLRISAINGNVVL